MRIAPVLNSEHRKKVEKMRENELEEEIKCFRKVVTDEVWAEIFAFRQFCTHTKKKKKPMKKMYSLTKSRQCASPCLQCREIRHRQCPLFEQSGSIQFCSLFEQSGSIRVCPSTGKDRGTTSAGPRATGAQESLYINVCINLHGVSPFILTLVQPYAILRFCDFYEIFFLPSSAAVFHSCRSTTAVKQQQTTFSHDAAAFSSY